MMKKIGVIGVEGTGARFATGQAIKCRTLRKWFCDKFGEDQVLFGNIDSAKKHPIRVANNMLRVLKNCTNVVFMPGQNIEIFAPVLHCFNKLYHRKILYIVTGGDLAEVIKRRPSLGKTIAHFAGVYVQSVKLRDELKQMGIPRAEYLPNCRGYTAAVPFDHYEKEPFRVCTYSRVTKEKGILDAIEICKKANALIGHKAFVLEVYGKMYDAFEPEFNKALEENKGLVTYEGVRDSSETWNTLHSCFAILFPTYFECECFAGTALDAFSARIPIIANDWLYNSEVIRSGVDGFIYDFRNNDMAAETLKRLYDDRALYASIQQGCEESMFRFSTDHVMGEFVKNFS
ncbi:MAG: glycosyltransferase family 4 protein [Clostridia bacterium]|nr:glycosyltransferase family 4 protein [Clostridia bacterium]